MKTLLISSLIAFLFPSLAAAQANPCESDVDGDGVVAGADLSIVLASWGGCSRCIADINGDSLVDGIDLSFVLSRWGGLCAPTAISLSVAAGPLAGGVPVTVQGDHLLNPTGVTFGGSPASVVASTRTSVTVIAPARPEGTATVVINTQGGTVVAGSFAYYGAPTITAVTPNTGPSVGGSVVAISGTGFYGSPSVAFGGVASMPVSVVSPTQLMVVVPPGEIGSTVAISVATTSGAAKSQGAFAYVAITVPSWATQLEAMPNPAVVTNDALRSAIIASGYAWRIRDNNTQIEMVLIPPGSFDMGCSPSSNSTCNPGESPVHSVTLTRAYYLARFEVTQAQWTARMGSNPSYFQPPVTSLPELNRPVEQVSWNAVQEYLASTGMRLPTEAEWEFACRADTTTAFHGFQGLGGAYLNGTNEESLVGNIAWTSLNAGGQTRRVGLKAGNGFGVHDMAGNVAEYCADRFGPYLAAAQIDPTGPESGASRVWRGGSWFFSAAAARSSHRGDITPQYGDFDFGFRVARNP